MKLGDESRNLDIGEKIRKKRDKFRYKPSVNASEGVH